MLKRVVITGIGGISALGKDWQTINTNFHKGENAVRYMPDWDYYVDLNTRLAAPIVDFEPPKHWTRKQLRSLGRVSQLCVAAAENALTDANLINDERIKDGRMGVACGSSTGSTQDIRDLSTLVITGKSPNFTASTYIKMMPHTTAANIAIFFGLKGRIIPTSSACASGSQGIGYAYEAIKYGKIPMMLAGGGEELCVSEAFVFDSLYAASTANNQPKTSPKPYDAHRDGLVLGEGSGILVLEEYEHALQRGAKIYAELIGFGSNGDGTHVTRPEATTMQACMQLALNDAQIDAKQIDYVNGHGTATEQGDIAETQATYQLFGKVPFSSQKSYLGHTLGACGALESWFSIEMMNQNSFAPTINLQTIDSRCGDLDYITNDFRNLTAKYIMTNNFAFGGVNTSLIFKKY